MGRDAAGKRKYLNQTVKGNKKDAEKVLTALLRKRDLGELPLEPTRMGVEEYLEYWLVNAAKPRLSEQTYKQYGDLLKRYIHPKLGTRRLTKLSALEI